MDRAQLDCFDTGTLNLSSLKVRSGDTATQTWSNHHRSSDQVRLPNVNVSPHSMGTRLDIRVDTERAVHMDTESFELQHEGLQTK